jgi:hypothetical protein
MPSINSVAKEFSESKRLKRLSLLHIVHTGPADHLAYDPDGTVGAPHGQFAVE